MIFRPFWATHDRCRWVKSQVLSQIGRNQLPPEVGSNLSPQRQDLIDQPVVRCVEWIDESNARQFKAILQVLGKQMANAGPLCRGL
jgi:hypothetical protein